MNNTKRCILYASEEHSINTETTHVRVKRPFERVSQSCDLKVLTGLQKKGKRKNKKIDFYILAVQSPVPFRLQGSEWVVSGHVRANYRRVYTSQQLR